MTETVTIESTIESWIGSCFTEEQLENMKEIVFDKVSNEIVQTNLITLIGQKQKSLGGNQGLDTIDMQIN